jgi:hypothetical protein
MSRICLPDTLQYPISSIRSKPWVESTSTAAAIAGANGRFSILVDPSDDHFQMLNAAILPFYMMSSMDDVIPQDETCRTSITIPKEYLIAMVSKRVPNNGERLE